MQDCTLCILYQDLKYHILSFSCGHVIIILSILPPTETLHKYLMKENIYILAKSIIFSFKISNKMWIIFGGKKNPTQEKTGILRNKKS